MRPDELTVDQVIAELTALVMEYPNRSGRVFVGQDDYGDDDYSCVYYTDQDGVPINLAVRGYNTDAIVLKTPVCLIGQWVETFHPELKEDAVIKHTLLQNSGLGSITMEDSPFDESVLEILTNAQMAQDSAGTLWGDIKIEWLSTGI